MGNEGEEERRGRFEREDGVESGIVTLRAEPAGGLSPSNGEHGDDGGGMESAIEGVGIGAAHVYVTTGRLNRVQMGGDQRN